MKGITRYICSHYDDGSSDEENGLFSSRVGHCLFDERDWAPGIWPTRCNDCPNVNRDVSRGEDEG